MLSSTEQQERTQTKQKEQTCDSSNHSKQTKPKHQKIQKHIVDANANPSEEDDGDPGSK
jgi:hypothetical protein